MFSFLHCTLLIKDSTYVPPRAAWDQQRGPVSPITNESSLSNLPSSNAMPANSGYSPRGASASPRPIVNRHHRSPSEPYYEDVDPRFAANEPHMDASAPQAQQSGLPTALTPGSNAYRMPPPSNPPPPTFNYHSPSSPTSHDFGAAGQAPPQALDTDDPHSTPSLDRADSSYEDLPQGVRSPTGSDTSHYTSISQRPVNPNWRPSGGYPGGFLGPPGADGGAHSSASVAQRRREDVILAANPEFSLPGMRGERGGRGRGGLARGQPSGLTPAGRYPTEI